MTAPAKWRLAGVPHSTECTVTWWVGYAAYYRRLEELINQTAKGDEVFIVGWYLDLSEVLRHHSLQYVLETAVKRKATVRALLTTLANHTENATAVKGVVALGGKAHQEDLGLTSGRVGGTFHQKCVYVRVKKEAHLFVGGADVAPGRLVNKISRWFDVSAEITGHAAELGRVGLEQRWAAVEKGAGSPAPFVPGKGQDLTSVQFVHTYGKKAGRAYAAAGEFDVHALLRNACAKATDTIYIEDQYFVGDRVNRVKPRSLASLDEALAAAVARGVQLVVVTTRGEQAETSSQYTPWKRRRELLDLLTRNLADRSRVKVFVLKKPHAPDVWTNYVHTKAWIFDDEFAVVGSANYTRMSMTFEGEFAVGVASDATVGAAASLRRQLWRAVLNAHGAPGGFSVLDVRDWATGLRSFASARSPLEPYAPNAGTDKTGPADPDGS